MNIDQQIAEMLGWTYTKYKGELEFGQPKGYWRCPKGRVHFSLSFSTNHNEVLRAIEVILKKYEDYGFDINYSSKTKQWHTILYESGEGVISHGFDESITMAICKAIIGLQK